MDREVTTNKNCLITAACQNYFKEYYDDNMYEIRMMKWFIKNYLFRDEIAHYYEVSPLIIDALENDAYGEVMYDHVYGILVEKCVVLIANRKYKKAFFEFRDNLQRIEDKILKPELEARAVNALALRYKQKMLRN